MSLNIAKSNKKRVVIVGGVIDWPYELVKEG